MMKSIKRVLDFQKLKEKGFTLIEMLVVVTIIGLLVAVVLPRFTSQVDTAKKERFNAGKYAIEQQAEIFYYKNGVYPQSGSANATTWSPDFTTHWGNKGVPTNPFFQTGTTTSLEYRFDQATGKVTTTYAESLKGNQD